MQQQQQRNGREASGDKSIDSESMLAVISAPCVSTHHQNRIFVTRHALQCCFSRRQFSLKLELNVSTRMQRSDFPQFFRPIAKRSCYSYRQKNKMYDFTTLLIFTASGNL